MIDNFFHFYSSKEIYNRHKEQGLIDPDSLCFISNTGKIIAQNEAFGNILKAGTGIEISEDNIISCTLDTTLFLVVTSLPSTGDPSKIYLLRSNSTGPRDIYTEYIYANNEWEKLGSFTPTVDLAPYLTKEEFKPVKDDVDALKAFNRLTVNSNVKLWDIIYYDNKDGRLKAASVSKLKELHNPHGFNQINAIGICVVPPNHNLYGDGTIGVMALKTASLKTPEHGGKNEAIPFGGFGGDYTLQNYSTVRVEDEESDTVCRIAGRLVDPFDDIPDNPSAEDIINSPRKNQYYDYVDFDSCRFNAYSDIRGKQNTEFYLSKTTVAWDKGQILPDTGPGRHPAACACARFVTKNTEKGDWYVPSCGELGYLYHRELINDILNELNSMVPWLGDGADPYTEYVPESEFRRFPLLDSDNFYWTSTEHADSANRAFFFTDREVAYAVRNEMGYVRPFIRLNVGAPADMVTSDELSTTLEDYVHKDKLGSTTKTEAEGIDKTALYSPIVPLNGNKLYSRLKLNNYITFIEPSNGNLTQGGYVEVATDDTITAHLSVATASTNEEHFNAIYTKSRTLTSVDYVDKKVKNSVTVDSFNKEQEYSFLPDPDQVLSVKLPVNVGQDRIVTPELRISNRLQFIYSTGQGTYSFLDTYYGLFTESDAYDYLQPTIGVFTDESDQVNPPYSDRNSVLTTIGGVHKLMKDNFSNTVKVTSSQSIVRAELPITTNADGKYTAIMGIHSVSRLPNGSTVKSFPSQYSFSYSSLGTNNPNDYRITLQLPIYDSESPDSVKHEDVRLMTISGTQRLIEESTTEFVTVEDLPNVKAEEVVNPEALDITVPTREELKQDLFDDLWKKAVGDFGNVDHTHMEGGINKPYMCNEIWMTYDEATYLYAHHSPSIYQNEGIAHLTVKTNIPVKSTWSSVHNRYAQNNKTVERLHLPMALYGPNSIQMFYNCTNLKSITGLSYVTGTVDTGAFMFCSALETLEIRRLFVNLDLRWSPLLKRESLDYITNERINTNSFNIVVHADVYAKLTGDTTNAAAATLTPEELAAWQQTLTNAVSKNITFVSA